MRVAMLLRCLGMMRGGGETRHLAWIRELDAMGIEVEVITGRPLFGTMRYPVDTGRRIETTIVRSPYTRDLIYRLQDRRGFGRAGALMLHADEEWFCRAAWRHLASARRRPDIVHAHALYQAARGRSIDVPVAINLPGEPHQRYASDLERADVLLSDGWGARRLPALLGRPVENIPKGVDAALFAPEGPNERASLGVGRAPVALSVSRFVPLKNVGLFVEAMASVHRLNRDARAVIVGDGPLSGDVKRKASALGLAGVVHFAGYVPQHELPRWYRTADVFVLPSDFDNSPNVILEAMASGLPVVATDAGGAADFLKSPEGGALVARGAAGQLADAVFSLLADPVRRREAGLFNRRRATLGFSWRVSAEHLVQAFRNALAARGRAA